MSEAARREDQVRHIKWLRDLGRAAGGAIIFSMPILMTMEMWSLAYSIDSYRLALLIIVSVPLLTELSHQIGFEETTRLRDDLVDALFALFVGTVVAVLMLVCFSVIEPNMSAREIIGKAAIQIVPAALGALLARSQFGTRPEDNVKDKDETYLGELFLMGVGALFLGFNVAPTEEIALISYRLTPWHALSLVLVSLLIMHGFVFAVGFRGGSQLDEHTSAWSAFIRLTVPGYLLALLISIYVLWTFERLADFSLAQTLLTAIVLSVPCSVGAAAARLIL